MGKFLVVEETPPCEDEVAQLEFFVPARLKDRVRRALIKRSVEILLEDGFDIGIGVYGVKKSEMSHDYSETKWINAIQESFSKGVFISLRVVPNEELTAAERREK